MLEYYLPRNFSCIIVSQKDVTHRVGETIAYCGDNTNGPCRTEKEQWSRNVADGQELPACCLFSLKPYKNTKKGEFWHFALLPDLGDCYQLQKKRQRDPVSVALDPRPSTALFSSLLAIRAESLDGT